MSVSTTGTEKEWSVKEKLDAIWNEPAMLARRMIRAHFGGTPMVVATEDVIYLMMKFAEFQTQQAEQALRILEKLSATSLPKPIIVEKI